MSFRNSRVVSLALALALVGCQKVPQQDIDQARESLVGVEAAGASEWAPAEVAAVEAAIGDLDAELTAQEEKLAFFRKYDKAKELAAAAVKQAAAASQAAEAARESARLEAEGTIAAVRTALDRGRVALEALTVCKSTPKDFAADRDALAARILAFEVALPAIETSFGEGAYRSVTADAGRLAGEVGILADEMEAAQAQLGC